MGSTGEQPTSELVAGLLDTARASRARTMQEVAGAWQRAGTITRNLILMASSEIGSIERPATNLVTQLHMYILVAGPEAATSRSQPPSSLGDGTPRALGGWLTELGHNVTSDSGDDPVVTAWQWLAGHQAFEVGRAVPDASCGISPTRTRPVGSWGLLCRPDAFPPTGHPPAEPLQVRGISVGFSASTTGTPTCRVPRPRRKPKTSGPGPVIRLASAIIPVIADLPAHDDEPGNSSYLRVRQPDL